MLEVRLLGQLDVVDGEHVLTPHRQKPRALLAALALRVGRPVSKDALVEDLWGEEPPRRATDALENYVSQLRKQLGRETIATLPAGYALDLAAEQVDAVRFERQVVGSRDASPARRSEQLRDALALLRGPPLADLAFEPFASAQIARLEELELTAREELVDAELALGRHLDVVADLEALVAAQPYRERPRAQLMLALYRCGRQAEALETYQDVRRMLVEELGIDPADQLRELEQAILRQDESLRAPARVERAGQAVELPASSARPSRKVVTVLVSSVVDPAEELGRLDPELLRSVLDRYLAAVRTAVERHGGTTARLAGADDLVAVFGVPAVHEDDALRAVRAAIEMRQAIADLNDELVAERGVFLQTRTGIDTGEVLVTEDPVPTGRPVATGRRLASDAHAGQIVLGERTRGLVRAAVETEELDGRRDAFRVVALVPGADGRTLRLDAPLVGRARPLQALVSAFDSAVDGRSCHLFTVLGAAGVGKSRLVRELAESLGDAARVLRGRCLPYGEGITYLPLLEALPDAASALEPTDPGERLHPRVRSVLEELARDRPLVLILDDLHWAEPAFLDLVEDVASTSREASLLVVCLARPELLEHRPGFGGGMPNSSSLLLEPLDEADSERLVDHLLGASDLPDVVRAHIVSVAEGNPLFVEELLATLVERAVLRRTGGRWTTTETVIPVPASIQALIAARIDRLPDPERLVLELASIEGKRFTRTLVAALAADEHALQLDAHLDALVRAELVRPRADGDFTFRHQLIRDEVYASMTKQVRAERHERLAALLGLEDDAALAELAAYHHEQARRLREEVGSSS